MPLFLLLCAVCLHCACPSLLLADYYKYTDNRGTVHMTNKLNSVPAQYRSNMKVTREEPKKDPAANQAPGAEPAAGNQPVQQEVAAPEPAPGKFAQLSSRFVWFKPLVWLVGGVALFIVVVKLTSLLSSPLLSKLIYLSFFMGVLVFLYKAYVNHLVEGTMKVKDSAVTMIKKSSNREVPGAEGEAPPAQR